MLAHFGDVWEDMYLEECEEDYNDEDMDVLPLVDADLSNRSPNSFREVLKKTTLETNYARGVLSQE
jgi:hypothetical protein